ncbi:hypothetical protein L208DRAFT_119992 [Tricholoma matsutake]|nr:hypothetical protein L208DRAFT_119992 [Tricholoma matsutake 945]
MLTARSRTIRRSLSLLHPHPVHIPPPPFLLRFYSHLDCLIHRGPIPRESLLPVILTLINVPSASFSLCSTLPLPRGIPPTLHQKLTGTHSKHDTNSSSSPPHTAYPKSYPCSSTLVPISLQIHTYLRTHTQFIHYISLIGLEFRLPPVALLTRHGPRHATTAVPSTSPSHDLIGIEPRKRFPTRAYTSIHDAEEINKESTSKNDRMQTHTNMPNSSSKDFKNLIGI